MKIFLKASKMIASLIMFSILICGVASAEKVMELPLNWTMDEVAAGLAVALPEGSEYVEGVNQGGVTLTGNPILIPTWALKLDREFSFAGFVYINKDTQEQGILGSVTPIFEVENCIRVDAVQGGRQIQGYVYDREGKMNIAISQKGVLIPDRWMHFAVTFDGSFLRLYSDGILAETLSMSLSGPGIKTQDVGEYLTIGFGNGRHFEGKMDEVVFYNKAISPSEVDLLYKRCKNGFKRQIVLHIDNPNMLVGEEEVEIDPGRGTVPVIIDDRTLVPIRAIIERMGGAIEWHGDEQRVRILLNNNDLSLYIDKTTATMNKSTLSMDVPPMLLNDRTMLPLRFVATQLGARIEWNGEEQRITLTY